MKAVRFHEYGAADVLRYEDVEQPTPGPGQVLIAVAGTTFNPVDAGLRGGYLREAIPLKLPHVPGIDVAGTIEAIGPDVRGHQPGEHVIAFLPMDADGGAAEFVLVPADVLASAPVTLPLADAAALPSVGLTAWQALHEHIRLESGQRLLINGAGGAVGGHAVQLAKRSGAYVVAMTSPRSAEAARAAGADEVWEVNSSAAIEPVDALLNLARVTPEQLEQLAQLVRPGGVVASTVPAAGSVVRPDVRMVPVFVRSDAEQLTALAALVDNGELQVEISERRPLAELHMVHARADIGALSGKVVLLPE